MAKAAKIEPTIPDQRMLELIEMLKSRGSIRFKQAFLNVIGLANQNITEIRLGTAHFTVERITRACKAYNVNANWVHGLSAQASTNQAEVHFIKKGAAPVKAKGKQKRS